MQPHWHLTVFRQSTVLEEVVAPLVFTPLIVLATFHAHPTWNRTCSRIFLAPQGAERVALIYKLAVVFGDTLANVETLLVDIRQRVVNLLGTKSIAHTQFCGIQYFHLREVPTVNRSRTSFC